MSKTRIVVWAFVAFVGLMPLNWLRLWATDGLSEGATFGSLLIGALVCWAIAGGVGFFLVVSARGIKRRQQLEEQELQELLSQPLVEIKPARALLKTGEKAYGAANAGLHELKTVGYSAGSKGISVRVAKGVTLRSGGMRGKAEKGVVQVATGELVITNERVIFAGDMKSFVIPLDSLLNTTNFSDGIGFSDNKTTYTLSIENSKERMVFAAIVDKVLRDR